MKDPKGGTSEVWVPDVRGVGRPLLELTQVIDFGTVWEDYITRDTLGLRVETSDTPFSQIRYC